MTNGTGESTTAGPDETLARLRAFLSENDSDIERAKHPEQFDMWITGYEQALLDVEGVLDGPQG